MKALGKASLGACIVSMDNGSKDRLVQQDPHIPENTTNTLIPKWLLPISQIGTDSHAAALTLSFTA